MKIDLTDVTFLLLVRLDSVQRLENTLVVTELLKKHFKTNIVIREASSYNNKVLSTALKKGIQYHFIEDKDPVLHKTRHFNEMTQNVETTYISIWDVDIIPDKKAVKECIDMLRKGETDISYPYNGMCYNIPSVIKELFFKKRDIRFLYRHRNKMDLLHKLPLVGGAVIMDRQQYLNAGAENEAHYGWSNDDFDRYYRFQAQGLDIHRAATCLFHLSHPRAENSTFSSSLDRLISANESLSHINISREEIDCYVRDKNNS